MVIDLIDRGIVPEFSSISLEKTRTVQSKTWTPRNSVVVLFALPTTML